ncbi:Canalicular multispecific organic anion transporter 2 [Actinomortierella ambigua]|nr:Canalicular multispecific organic anion transporter 2 [Actinomortierella ambigua]
MVISRKVFSKAQPHGLGITIAIYLPSQLCLLGACASLIARAILLSQESSNWIPATMFSTVSLAIAWALGVVLNHLQHRHTIRSNNALVLFYIIALVGAAITIRTLHDTLQTSLGSFKAFCAYFAFILVGFVVEVWPRGRTAVQKNSGASAYEKSNLISRLWFHYIQQIVALGYRRPLQIVDVQGMLPPHIRTENSYGMLSQKWAAYEAHCRAKRRKPRLMPLILRTYFWKLLPALILQLMGSTMSFAAPQLLDKLLSFIESYRVETPEPVSLGLILAFGMFFSTLTTSMFENQFSILIANVGIEVRTALVSMIYRKSLKLSPDARQQSTAGEISNHMSVDSERFWEALPMLTHWISIPYELCFALWLLYRQLGWSAMAGLGTLVIITPIQGSIAATFSKAKDRKLAAMDNRIRLMNEVLAGIKIVKLYGWEDAFRQKIAMYRKKELAILKKIGIAFSFMTIMFSSATLLMALASFSFYAAFGSGVITPQVIFVSITLFGMLNRPIGMLSHIMSETIGLVVAARRIQRFLLMEELDENQIDRSDELPMDGRPVIEVRDGVFAWEKEPCKDETELERKARTKFAAKLHKRRVQEAKEAGLPEPEEPDLESKTYAPVLRDIQLTVDRGSISMIVGRVAQGKSSLLNCIIGDMYVRRGSVSVRGRLAYVPQQAWVVNATLKDNIVFGLPFDQEKYDRIVFACGLKPDLEMLPAGDMTEIGERGINLSGGQKQRVSLARAAYQDADVYLLDDPLSAVDAHVDQHLWMNLIGPKGMLKDKTRLLVTHGIHHLSEADQIILLKGGEIDESGRYDELMAAKGDFFQLIEEYSIKAQSEKQDATAADDGDIMEDGAKSTMVQTHAAETKEIYKEKEDTKGELVEDEAMEHGALSWSVYHMYAKAASYRNAAIMISIFILQQGCQTGTNLWLKYWINFANDAKQTLGYFMGIYAAMIVAYMLLTIWSSWATMAVAGVRASKYLHNGLLNNVLRLPMSFFDTTPVGRLVNRFSSDVFSVDEMIPWQFHDMLFCMVAVTGTLIVIAVTTPIFLAVIPFLFAIYVFVQRYYIASSRAFRRIEAITRSPLYQHFSETLNGTSSLRAMRCQERFIAENALKSDQSSNAHFLFTVAGRWLNVRLEAIGSLIVLCAALFAVFGRKSIDPSMVGLSLSYALNITQDITWMVRCYCELQNELISVERIDQYTKETQEAPNHTDVKLPDNWPDQGHIEFKDYSTRYRQGMDLVLKNVSFEVQPGEKVGIVGRTGAGKSSLTLALFRIIEAANSAWAMATYSHNSSATNVGATVGTEKSLEKIAIEEDGGSIWIDGVDISTVGLEYLRQHLAIIPQDPTLFVGTVRQNLDPFNELQDDTLWEALERSHLKEYIASMPGGLMYEVAQNGENFSVGQRSLICLARALLRKTKILVLDEATSSVDVQTDELIQRTIRTEFKDRTILTIAHRIKTVMDYDKILVLEKGRVVEFAPPSTLLSDDSTIFYSLAQQAGEVAV